MCLLCGRSRPSQTTGLDSEKRTYQTSNLSSCRNGSDVDKWFAFPPIESDKVLRFQPLNNITRKQPRRQRLRQINFCSSSSEIKTYILNKFHYQ